MLASSFGGSDDIFEYVESTENAPSRLVNTPDLVVHTRDLETMHKVPEEEFNTIVRLRAIFSHIGDLKITELVDAETNLTKNLQENDTTTPVFTQPSSPHSLLEDTLAAPAETLTCPRVKDRYTATQARAEDLPDVQLLGADDIFFGVYQNWVHQNSGEHFDGGIAEDSK